MNSRSFVCLIFLIVFLENCYAEITKFDVCPDFENQCTIHQLRINPCKEGLRGKPCKLKKGAKADISIDWTPDFSSDTLFSLPVWAGVKELEFAGMEKDGCKHSPCPIIKGQKMTYDYTIEMAKKYPSGNYNIKWKLGPNKDDIKCCVYFSVKL